MKDQIFQFTYQVFESDKDLTTEDLTLITKARAITKQAYAPYSNFHVGAVASLSNGSTIAGTNQENASYPVGICAERVLLGNAATQYPGVSIESLAISYESKDSKSDHPISPCGMCRQALVEYETRTKYPIRLVLGGQLGKIYIVDTASFLLPFAFTSGELL